jgi:hypothetical protein
LHSLLAIYPFSRSSSGVNRFDPTAFSPFIRSIIGTVQIRTFQQTRNVNSFIAVILTPFELRVIVEGADIDFETLLLWLYLRLS